MFAFVIFNKNTNEVFGARDFFGIKPLYYAKKAEQHIITTDKYRAGFYKYHTGREWKNPENYDLCLNTGKFDYETCVDIIENYIKTRLAGNN